MAKLGTKKRPAIVRVQTQERAQEVASYQIIVKHGAMAHFRFRSHDGLNIAQISPSAYKNGEQLLKQLTAIIDQEKLVVDIIEK